MIPTHHILGLALVPIFLAFILLYRSRTSRKKSSPVRLTKFGRDQKLLERVITLSNNRQDFSQALHLASRARQKAKTPVGRHNADLLIREIRQEQRARRRIREARQNAAMQIHYLPEPLNNYQPLDNNYIDNPHHGIEFIDEDLIDEDFIVWATNQPVARTPELAYAPDKARNDPQNVHDHQVQNDVRHILNSLDTEKNVNPENRDADLHEAIGRLESQTARENALVVLNYIRLNRSAEITGLGCTLGEVLDRVHTHIRSRPERDLLLDTLALELSESCGSSRTPLCLTGISARILGTLDNSQEGFQIRPEWALREELMNRAGVHHKDGREPEEIGRLLHEEYDSQVDHARVESIIGPWLNSL